MTPDKALVQKFLKNECTDEEAAFLQSYFEAHPEALETYMPMEELLAPTHQQLDVDTSYHLLERIRGNYGPAKKAFPLKPILRYAVAAAIIGVVAFIGIQLMNDTNKTPVVAVQVKDPTEAFYKKLTNAGTTIMEARLPDNSRVRLYPHSTIQYLPAFEPNKRNIYLSGKANFQVTKDATKPFTVYAAGMATTALGTQFIVEELDSQKVSVVLLEGSVKVRAQYALQNTPVVILKPGDKLLVYDRQFSNYTLTHSATKDQPKTITEKPTIEKNALAFKNVPLKDVFKTIEEKFDVTIQYENLPAIEEKLFTGTFLERDNLDFILSMICKLHGLQYTTNDSTITISKS